MPSDAQYREISPDLPFYTVAMMNSASTFLRIIRMVLPTKIALPNVITPAPLMSRHRRLHVDSSHRLWGGDDRRQLVLWALLRSLDFSSTKAQLPTVLPSVNVAGTMMGMTFSICALGLSVGLLLLVGSLGITNI